MDKTVIKELNAVLKGENMAVDSYERFLQNVQNEKIKNEFQRIQQDHKQHTIKISERIQDLGGKPKDRVGFTGKFVEAVSGVKNAVMPKNDYQILKDAYNGEKMGIELVNELIKGDLDSESSKLINDIMEEDRDHLQRLNHIIGSGNNLQ